MRILFIRHADPDYEHNTITERGHREAKILAAYLAGEIPVWHLDDDFKKPSPGVREPIDYFYVSPYGRAIDTARYTLDKFGTEAQTLDWLKEFPGSVDINASMEVEKLFPTAREYFGVGPGEACPPVIPWDMLPSQWVGNPDFLDPIRWRKTVVAKHSSMVSDYETAAAGLDALLASHGYERKGRGYTTAQGHDQTIALFCHFGITSICLAHLMNDSPWHFLQHTVLCPTSVTEVFTEEREKGVVVWRARRIGDCSHLNAAGEEIGFHARFCSVYENTDERH